MTNLKQNIWVVAILFLSLLSSVALSYVITPNSNTLTESVKTKNDNKVNNKKKDINESLIILIPKVVK